MKIVVLDGYTENPGNLSWESNADWCFRDYLLIEPADKTMGIIGFGRIGQQTGRIAKAMGMQDLADALNSGKVCAAGLDVVSTEPIRGDNPLLQAKNCIITPQISWAPRESRRWIMDCAVSNLKAYQNGAPVNVVN